MSKLKAVETLFRAIGAVHLAFNADASKRSVVMVAVPNPSAKKSTDMLLLTQHLGEKQRKPNQNFRGAVMQFQPKSVFQLDTPFRLYAKHRLLMIVDT